MEINRPTRPRRRTQQSKRLRPLLFWTSANPSRRAWKCRRAVQSPLTMTHDCCLLFRPCCRRQRRCPISRTRVPGRTADRQPTSSSRSPPGRPEGSGAWNIQAAVVDVPGDLHSLDLSLPIQGTSVSLFQVPRVGWTAATRCTRPG